ncbi:MAG TPA: glycosyltransferase family 39 protein [Ktedonobacterales bacterium]
MSQRSSTAPAAPEPPGSLTSSAAARTSGAASGEYGADKGAPAGHAGWRWARLAWWNLLIPALIAYLTWLPRIALVHSLDLITDESVYIPTGVKDLHLLETGSLQSAYWLVNFEAPSLPKLIMGLGANYGSSHLGAQGVLYGARLPGVLLIMLTLVLAYFLARPIFGRAGATFGALALALSPWLAYFNAIAYLDTYLLCFMTLAALLTWHAARRPWLWPLVGALVGLAFASKYTAAFVAVPVVAYLVFYCLFISRRRPPWQAALALPIGLMTVYIFDPAIWVDPVARLWHSILFQYNHASAGHDAFWNGVVGQHVPPGIGIYILLAKVSLFITIPALLALPWALWRLVRVLRERQALTALDDTAAFALVWLGGMLPMFGSLNIIVGAHYVLPLAPPVTFTAGWAYTSFARWLASRLSPWAQARSAALARLAPDARLARRIALSEPLARRLMIGGFAALIALSMLLPSTIGLLTVNQAEGYTAEWLHGENGSLQVAYPAYADAVQWIAAHSQGRTTVTLVMSEKGALDDWLGTRQSIFPSRIRLAVGTPGNFPHSQFIVWPEHLVQRQFPMPKNFHQLIVARIQGGSTTYCYILLWPHPDR